MKYKIIETAYIIFEKEIEANSIADAFAKYDAVADSVLNVSSIPLCTGMETIAINIEKK